MTVQELDEQNDEVPEVHRFEVATGDEFIHAVNTIKSGSGAYEIVLKDDIEVNQSVKFYFDPYHDKANLSLTICSEGTQYTIRHTAAFPEESSWFDFTNMGTVTFRNVALRNEAALDRSLIYSYHCDQLVLDNCLLDGGSTLSYSANGFGTYGTPIVSLTNTTIQNCYISNETGGGGAFVYGASQMIMDHSTITNCTVTGVYGDGLYGGGGLAVQDSSLTMTGSTITNCHTDGVGGGLNVRWGNSISILSDSRIYNNTILDNSTDSSHFGASDIFIYEGSIEGSITLPDVAAQGLTSTDGHKIDGWYREEYNSRYDHTHHVDALTDLTLNLPNWSSFGVVASYAVYDIAFDYSTTDGETNTCHAYKDAAAANAITVAPTDDKVYLTYDGALDDDLGADEVLYWDVVDADGTAIAVTPAKGSTPACFTMPEKPAGNKVTATPKVIKASELPADPDAPAGGDDDTGSGDSGAAGIVAGALLGTATYLVGTDIWLNNLYGYIPEHRIQLAEALWNKADCPAPQSTELYPDIDADDDDAQAAARWCVEQGLMKDYRKTDKDGNEEVTFKPARHVLRPQAIRAWYNLEKLLNEQAKSET